MAHILYMSNLLIMVLSTFYGPFIICDTFVIFISNEFKLLYYAKQHL